MSLELLYLIMVFIIGLVFGSFFNVVGYRVPNKMSIIYPDSHCPNCNHKLKFYELVPVLSYVFLGGKCKSCKKRISIFYPFFELLTGILFALCYLSYGISIKFFIGITLISILVIISISDFKYYIIPDEVLIAGTILIIIELIIGCIINNTSVIKNILFPILSGVLAFITIYIFKVIGDKVFKKECLGGGDVKLLFFIGLALGYDMSLVTVFLAAFIALPFSIIGLIKNNNNVIPFGPYLSMSAIIILLTKMDLNMIFNFFSGR